MQISVSSCLFVVLFTVLPVRMTLSQSGGNANSELARTRREAANEVLVFPKDEIPHKPSKDSVLRSGISADLTALPCPDDQVYCDAADDYPEEQIKELLQKQPKAVLNQFYAEVDLEDDVNRFSPDGDIENQLCTAKFKTVYPKKVKSAMDGRYEFIVNTEQHKQGVRVEECSNSGSECSIPGSLSLGYTSQCLQKHIVRTLVVFNGDSSSVEGFVTKPFEFPSCCSCFVSMHSPAARFGLQGPIPHNRSKNTKS